MLSKLRKYLVGNDLLINQYIWLMMYGFAGFGWLIVHIVPQMAFLILTIKADFTIKKLQGLQRQLVEEWGEKVKEGRE